MLFDDTYLTIEKQSEGIFTDRGSKFIAYAMPINTENDLKEYLGKIKIEHPKARHHCWALRLTPDRTVYRINDDGEPSGTAGRPLLNILLSANLTNILIVVVRYFGGTLLGVPGLINAYKKAGEEALAQANVIEKTLNDVYSITFNYVQMNEVMRIIKETNTDIIRQQFDNSCEITISIRKQLVNTIIDRMLKLPDVKTSFLYSS